MFTIVCKGRKYDKRKWYGNCSIFQQSHPPLTLTLHADLLSRAWKFCKVPHFCTCTVKEAATVSLTLHAYFTLYDSVHIETPNKSFTVSCPTVQYKVPIMKLKLYFFIIVTPIFQAQSPRVLAICSPTRNYLNKWPNVGVTYTSSKPWCHAHDIKPYVNIPRKVLTQLHIFRKNNKYGTIKQL